MTAVPLPSPPRRGSLGPAGPATLGRAAGRVRTSSVERTGTVQISSSAMGEAEKPRSFVSQCTARIPASLGGGQRRFVILENPVTVPTRHRRRRVSGAIVARSRPCRPGRPAGMQPSCRISRRSPGSRRRKPRDAEGRRDGGALRRSTMRSGRAGPPRRRSARRRGRGAVFLPQSGGGRWRPGPIRDPCAAHNAVTSFVRCGRYDQCECTGLPPVNRRVTAIP